MYGCFQSAKTPNLLNPSVCNFIYSLLNPLHASLNSEIGTSSLFNPNFSIAFFSVGIPCVSNPGMNGVSNPFKFLYLTIVSFKILFKACPM